METQSFLPVASRNRKLSNPTLKSPYRPKRRDSKEESLAVGRLGELLRLYSPGTTRPVTCAVLLEELFWRSDMPAVRLKVNLDTCRFLLQIHGWNIADYNSQNKSTDGL